MLYRCSLGAALCSLYAKEPVAEFPLFVLSLEGCRPEEGNKDKVVPVC